MVGKVVLCWLLVSMQNLVSCQDLSWSWIYGSKTGNVLSSKTEPGGRSGSAYVKLGKNTVWMFGGEHHVGGKSPGLSNDLWRYDMTSNTWTLVHNGTAASIDDVPQPRQLAAACGVQNTYFVVYGGLDKDEKVLGDTWLFHIPEKTWYKLDEARVKFGAHNSTVSMQALLPSARGDAAVWCIDMDRMFIFGGFDEKLNLHYDMWQFDLVELLWTEVRSSVKLPKDTNFKDNLIDYPKGRSGATTWVTADHHLYMFGGNIKPKNKRSLHLNTGNSADIWIYHPKNDIWTLLSDLDTTKECKTHGNYGELGLTSPTNHPGCRRKASAWVDIKNNLWMFGGDGIDDKASVSLFVHSSLLSDIWFFDTKKFQWIWKGGKKSGDQKGEFGEQGVSGKDNLPGSRCESIVWVDEYGLFTDEEWQEKFYLAGGVGHDGNGQDGYLNDVWMLDVTRDESITGYTPAAGKVWGIIILGIVLVAFIAVLFICNRKTFKEPRKSVDKVKYTQLSIETDEL